MLIGAFTNWVWKAMKRQSAARSPTLILLSAFMIIFRSSFPFGIINLKLHREIRWGQIRIVLQQSKDLNDSLLAWIHIFLDRLHNRLTFYNEKVIPDYVKKNRIEKGVFSWPVVVRSNQFPNNMVKEINEFDNCTFFHIIVLYEEGTLPNKLLLNCFSIKNFANGL